MDQNALAAVWEKLKQTWPARLAGGMLQAAALPGDVYQGNVSMLDQYGRTNPEVIGRSADLAGMVMGGGMPMAEKGAAGIFGGRLAQTADHTALGKAEKLHATGASREEIWKETGWFKGSDDKWRFEIADDASKVSDRVASEFNSRHVGDQVPVQNADRFLDHPELFNAYPDLWRVNTRLEKGGGYPYTSSGNYMVRESGAENVGLNASSLGQANSLALHELQHAIQAREGFAKGADATAVGRDVYNRSAGEVEAYNVQRRKFMTPEERRKTPPWETQNIPDEQQIVNYLYNYDKAAQ